MMLGNPKQLFTILGGVLAGLLVVSVALGSSGTTEGDPDTGQQVANVTFPMFLILLIVTVALLVVHLRRSRRSQPDRKGVGIDVR